jgi:DNA-binding LytR/AlgR family response regulator
MKKYSCLIVEDEPIAAEVLQDYIGQIAMLDLVAVCRDALYAIDLLQEKQVDLIFLDIHLPRLKGLDFLKTLNTPPKVIITSAYPQYALEGFELNVLDYLLKPIEFSRFLAAVNKMKLSTVQGSNTAGQVIGMEDRPHQFFNVSKRQIKIYFDDIHFIESQREYIRIVTKTKSILTKMQISEIEALLPQSDFIRIHRSYIVSRKNIESFSQSEVEVGTQKLPIGRNYKETVLNQLPSVQ